MQDTHGPTASTKTHRRIRTLFGIFFVALDVLIIVTSESSTRLGAISAAIVIGGPGLVLI